MGLMIEKVRQLAERSEIVKYTKYKENNEDAKHLVNYKKEKEYDYYLCDYCLKEIKITDKWEERTGGVIELPLELSKRGKVKVAMHNKCLKQFLKEMEMEINDEKNKR